MRWSANNGLLTMYLPVRDLRIVTGSRVLGRSYPSVPTRRPPASFAIRVAGSTASTDLKGIRTSTEMLRCAKLRDDGGTRHTGRTPFYKQPPTSSISIRLSTHVDFRCEVTPARAAVTKPAQIARTHSASSPYSRYPHFAPISASPTASLIESPLPGRPSPFAATRDAAPSSRAKYVPSRALNG